MKSPRDVRPRYLIGNGEKLTAITDATSGPPGEKINPYSLADAAMRLAPRLAKTVHELERLPSSAMPGGRAVALVTMHHEFIAKSFFPVRLFHEFALTPIGSRARKVHPEKWGKKPKHALTEIPETIELYVSATRNRLRDWAQNVSHFQVEELCRIEDIRPLSALDETTRIVRNKASNDPLLEVALHTEGFESSTILAMFARHAGQFGAEVYADHAADVPGLVFVPVSMNADVIEAAAQFTFLRTIRPIAKLRSLPETKPIRSLGKRYTLSSPPPLNPAMRVAVNVRRPPWIRSPD